MTTVGRVCELWRYPVKGLVGERLSTLDLDAHGVVGDRRFAVRGMDGKLGSAKTTRRFRRMPNLLSMRSRTTADGSVAIDFGDGADRDVAAQETASAVSQVVGEPVALATESDVCHLDDGPVHVLTTASLDWLQRLVPTAAVDRRRFRPNILVECGEEGLVEERWVGRDLLIGDVRLRAEARVVRCVTVALAQEELPMAPAIPRELERANDFRLGIYASVTVPGAVHVGAAVVVDDSRI